MVYTLFIQAVIMFLLAGIGYIMFKTEKITNEGSKTIGNVLIFLSLPCVMINGLVHERTPETMMGLLLSALFAAVLLLISMIVSKVFFRSDAIAVFSSSFSNPGFFGVPLIIGSLSSDAVFFIASFIVFLNILQFTYGVFIMTLDKKNISIKNILKAPAIIAMFIGLFFFFTGFKIPKIPASIIQNIANLNTPLAMFTIGVYMAQTDIKKMFLNKKNYFISLTRLIVIPVLSIFVLFLLPEKYMDMRYALLIAAACPVGANVAVYAQIHNKDYAYAVEGVVISTIFSILTIPAVIYLAEILWKI